MSSFGRMIDESVEFAKQNPLSSYKTSSQMREFLLRGHSEALSDLFSMCDKVHGAGSAASAKSQLVWSCACKAKAGILQKETVWAKAAKRLFKAWY